MSPQNAQDSTNNSVARKIDSSIVHKPFATGKVNFFSPFKNKTHRQETGDSQLTLNDELDLNSLPSPQLERQTSWLFNAWSCSAIAILLLTNLTALGIMKMRDAKPISNLKAQTTPNIGNSDLTAREFMPLNLSTLSNLSHNEQPQAREEPDIVPDSLIPPAFIPFNSDTFLSPTNQYHYVLAQYTGDRSLELAREKVANISIVHLPQGMFIYLGAFAEKKPASEFVSKLQQTGIEAKIYPFDR